MILRAENEKAALSFPWRGKARSVNINKLSVLDVDIDKKIVIVRNMWSGAHEKYIADSDLTRIQLDNRYLDKLMFNPHFKELENWKPCM